MSRRGDLAHAAHWLLCDGDLASDDAPPHAAVAAIDTLDDPALTDALTQLADVARLSDSDIRAMRVRRRQALAAGGAAALVATLWLGGVPRDWFPTPAAVVSHYETQRGEHREIQLADGTRIDLNGATSLDVSMSARARTVDMQRGEAFFDVAHEANRPFAVHAGDSGTRVLGTAFDIDIGVGDVKLAVYRGRVTFGRYGHEDDGVSVPAGWRSRFSRGAASVPRRFDATQQDWREDWLNTDDISLGDLVQALNRQRGPTIVAPPPKLAAIKLSGRFKLDDPAQLLAAIGYGYGFSVRRDGNLLRLVPADSTG